MPRGLPDDWFSKFLMGLVLVFVSFILFAAVKMIWSVVSDKSDTKGKKAPAYNYKSYRSFKRFY
jgi:hypothetical protein